MRITVPMPMYMSVLSVGSLLCVYPLALCLVPCQADTDEYLTERERPVLLKGRLALGVSSLVQGDRVAFDIDSGPNAQARKPERATACAMRCSPA